MFSRKNPDQLMAPIPDRAYQGIMDAKKGKDLGNFVRTNHPGKPLHGPVTPAPATRKMRKRGGKTVERIHGEKPHRRLDRKSHAGHEDASEDRKMIKEMIHKHEKHDHPGHSLTPLRKGGRLERKTGGPAKGKTNINIIIGSPKGGDQGQPQSNVQPMPPPPMARPIMPPPQAGPPMPPPGMMPPGGPGMGMPPMARKNGGRLTTFPGYKMDSGSLSGEGRLDKEKWYGGQRGSQRKG